MSPYQLLYEYAKSSALSTLLGTGFQTTLVLHTKWPLGHGGLTPLPEERCFLCHRMPPNLRSPLSLRTAFRELDPLIDAVQAENENEMQ